MNPRRASTRLWTAAAALVLGPAIAWGQQDAKFGFATDTLGNSVHVVDMENSVLVISATVGTAPRNIISSRDGRFVFVMNAQSSNITPFRVESPTAPLAAIQLGGFAPFDMAVSLDGQYLYIAATFRLIVVDIPAWENNPANAIKASIPLSLPGELNITNTAVGVSPDGGSLYVAADNFSFTTFQTASNVMAFNAGDFPDSGIASYRGGFKATVTQSSNIEFRNDSTRAFVGKQIPFMVVDAISDSLIQTVNMPAIVGEIRANPGAQGGIYAPREFRAELFKVGDLDLSSPQTIPLTLPGEAPETLSALGVDFARVADHPSFIVTLDGTPSHVRAFDITTLATTALIPLPGISVNKIAVPIPAPPPADITAPLFSSPEIAVAGSGQYQSPEVAVSSNRVDGRISVRDAQSGLDTGSLNVQLSTDGGVGFFPVPSASITGVSGSTSTEQITAPDLGLSHSLEPGQPLNYIRYEIPDVAGNVSVATTVVTVNLNPVKKVIAVSPANGAAFSQAWLSAQWQLDPDVPIGAISAFVVEVATSTDFSPVTTSKQVAAPTLATNVPVPEGPFYWRVRAIDKFGQSSLPSDSRSFTRDSTPPQYSDPRAAVAGLGNFLPINEPVPSLDVDVQVHVADALTSVAFNLTDVSFSTDSGASFTPVPPGIILPDKLQALNLPLAHSLSPSQRLNVVRFSVPDAVGNLASTDVVVAANLNPVSPSFLVSPGDGASFTGNSATFTWTPGTQVPIAAIDSFELQVAADSGFSNIIATQLVDSPGTSANIPLSGGIYYWRVRAFDNFGSTSPYSAPRSFVLIAPDVTPPELYDAEVSVAFSNMFQSTSTPLAADHIDAHIKVRDTESGLSAAVAAYVSVGGADGPFVSVPAAITGSPGSTSIETLSISNALVTHSVSTSLPVNFIRYVVSDLSGNQSQIDVPVLVNFNSVRQPDVSATPEFSTFTATPVSLQWAVDPDVLVLAIDHYEVELAPSLDFSIGVQKYQSPYYQLAIQITPPEGTHYWRVHAYDNFGSSSPYSATRSFLLDIQGPGFFDAEVAEAGSGSFVPSTTLLSTTTVDTRISVKNGASGLKIDSLQVQLSTDGGATFSAVSASVTGVDGSLNVETVSADGLHLAQSWSAQYPRNILRYSMLDLVGHQGTADIPLNADVNSQHKPVPVAPENAAVIPLSSTTIEWALDPAIAIEAIDFFALWWADNPAFNNPQFIGVEPPSSSAILGNLTNATYYWKVQAWSKFYTASPQSETRAFLIDAPVPEFSGALTKAPILPDFQSADLPIPATSFVQVRISVQDVDSGLRLDTLQAEFSSDDGATFSPVPATITGSSGTKSLEQIDLTIDSLAHSISFAEPRNLLKISIRDMLNNIGQIEIPLHATLNPITNLVLVGETVVGNTVDFAWQMDPAVPLAAIDSFELQIATGTFNNLVKTKVVPAPSLTTQETLPDGNYIWRARATDNFGLDSGFGGPRSFSIITVTTTTSPDNVVTLVSNVPELSISTVSTETPQVSLALATAAQAGLELVSAVYDITPSTSFSPAATLTFRFDPATVGDLETLALYRFDGTSWSSAPVTSGILSQVILDGDDPRIEAQLAFASYFALFVKDRTPPSVAVAAPVQGSTLAVLTVPFILALYSDNRLIDPASVHLYLDAMDVTSEASIFVSSASYTPASLPSDGAHNVTASVADTAGNVAVAHSAFTIDATPPATSFEIIGASAVVSGVLYMAESSSVSLSASDAGVGVERLEYSVDGGALQVTPRDALFTLAKGTHVISFQAADRIGNVEELQSAAVSVNGTAPVTEFSILGSSAIVNGELFMAEASTAVLTAHDLGAGVERIEYSIDDGPLQTAAADEAAFTLPEGGHAATFQAVDKVGNREQPRTQDVKVDGTPPATLLTVAESTVPAGPLTIFASQSLGFLPADPESAGVSAGVDRTLFSVDSGPFEVFTGTFSLSVGTWTVSFQSIDKVDNQETLQSVPIEVLPAVIVTLDLDPDTLNLKSQGQFVNAFIEVTGQKTSSDIAPLTLRITKVNDLPLAEPIPLNQDTVGKKGQLQHVHVGDHDSDGIADLAIKFDRAAVIDVVPVQEQVRITVEGSFQDGDTIEVSDFIRTIKPGAIPSHMGGVAKHSNFKVEVSIPAGALVLDAEISIVKVSAAPSEDEDKQDQAASRRTLKRRGRPFDFGPEGTQFARPVTISLPYDENELDGVDPATLKIGYWNPVAEEWEPLASAVDRAARTVSAQTTHFSQYQVLETPEPAAAPSSTLHVGEVYVFPSPAVGGAAPTFHIETDAAASITIRVYDISGAQVHETSLAGAPSLIDDGQGPQWACEYPWQAHIASGVYIYVVNVERSGQKETRRGKFAVIR